MWVHCDKHKRAMLPWVSTKRSWKRMEERMTDMEERMTDMGREESRKASRGSDILIWS